MTSSQWLLPAHRPGVTTLLLALTALAYSGVSGAAAHGRQPQDPLLSPERVHRLAPPLLRPAWLEYIAVSEQHATHDRAVMDAELAALGQSRWTPAPQGPALIVHDSMTADWFRSSHASRTANAIISYQTPAGGWSKRVDYGHGERPPGVSWSVSDGWSYIGTFDNEATTEQLRFLAGIHAATDDARYREAFLRGLDYIFSAQFPNGCWPQVYPLQGGYNDAATFNDEAMVNVLELLRDIERGTLGSATLLPYHVRGRALASLERGVSCVTAAQVTVDGVPTVWGAQHDPLTLQPTHARSYEHASLSGGESTGIVRFLMQIDSPDARIIRAVHTAVAWFRQTAIHGYTYDMRTGLAPADSAGPVWARFNEIGTNRPIFSNRDGVILYEWDQLDEERRVGYAWYRDSAQGVLRTYEQRWARRFPER